MPASAVTLNFKFDSADTTGTGAATFDITGAPSLDPYEYRAGDTFVANFTFGSTAITFTEGDALNPILVFFQSGQPSDIFYSGSLIESAGTDLGIFDFISLSMGDGSFSMQAHYDTGEEASFGGTYKFIGDEPPATAVPEPASAALACAGLVALIRRRRR
jgi:hypothetical protein